METETVTEVVENSTVTPDEATVETVVKPGKQDPNPTWLPSRLERERQSILKELGASNLDEAKAAVQELNLKREAEKSTAQRAGELATQLESERKSKSELEAAVKIYAAGVMGQLNEEQVSAVKLLAGDDAAKQLKYVEALLPTWKAQSTTPPTGTPKPPKPPVLDTAPGRTAPDSDVTTTVVNHKQAYLDLKTSGNPFAAASYALRHPEVYKK